jgi:hypothetical protein
MRYEAVWHVSCVNRCETNVDGDPDGADATILFTVSLSF